MGVVSERRVCVDSQVGIEYGLIEIFLKLYRILLVLRILLKNNA